MIAGHFLAGEPIQGMHMHACGRDLAVTQSQHGLHRSNSLDTGVVVCKSRFAEGLLVPGEYLSMRSLL